MWGLVHPSPLHLLDFMYAQGARRRAREGAVCRPSLAAVRPRPMAHVQGWCSEGRIKAPLRALCALLPLPLLRSSSRTATAQQCLT